MKIAYVVPRYGGEVLGGAETGARMLAERLVAAKGWKVDIFTTCAVDAHTWADDLPAGESTVNGVRVFRFRSKGGRDPNFEYYSRRLFVLGRRASPATEQRWIELQGPVCPDLVEAAASSDADLVIFYPYLYYPTVRGVPAVGDRAVMHPAAHDELPLRLSIFKDVFAATKGLVFHSDAERMLVERRFPVAHHHQLLLGLGVEPAEGDADAARAALGVADAPYLVCLGRVDDGKGTSLLARYFAAFKARRPGPLKLVYIGPVVHPPPSHPDIVVAGPAGEAVKWGGLRGALALVSPAPLESFGLAVIEAWTAHTPVLVNAFCQPTVENVARSGGGLSFGGYGQFEAALDRLMGDEGIRTRLAGRGHDYATGHYAWSVLISRYSRFLEGLGGRPEGRRR